MKISKKIKMTLAYKGVSEAELTRNMGTSPSALNQRMKTGKFSDDDYEKIAAALGAVFTACFEFPDGTKI